MASNLQLSELEQRVLDYVKRYPRSTDNVIIVNFNLSSPPKEVRQAIAQLIALGFISADENLRYVAVGKEI